MAVDKPHIHEPGIYFITFTNYHWLPLFEITQGYDLVYKWFDVLRTKGHDITGYVIMPNHLHLLLAYRQCQQSLNTIVGNGKRFLAYDIVARLKQKAEVPLTNPAESPAGDSAGTGQEEQQRLLAMLAGGVKDWERPLKKLHQVFEPSFDAKICLSQPFLLQKLNYMHGNPASGKWQLVADAIDYLHSSALFYETGRQGIYPVRSWVDLSEDLSVNKVTYRGRFD